MKALLLLSVLVSLLWIYLNYSQHRRKGDSGEGTAAVAVTEQQLYALPQQSGGFVPTQATPYTKKSMDKSIPFTVTNQEPVTNVPSLWTLWAAPLPIDLRSNLSEQYPNSHSIAKFALLSDEGHRCRGCPYFTSWEMLDTNTYYLGGMRIPYVSTDKGATNEVSTYYCDASHTGPPENCRLYTISGGDCEFVSGGPYNPVGVRFWAPNRAKQVPSTTDESFTDWDQSNNIYIALYCQSGRCASYAFPNCNTTNANDIPCDIGHPIVSKWGQCQMNQREESTGWSLKTISGSRQVQGWSSPGWAANTGELRKQEIIQGQINHAIYLAALCSNRSVVFPNTYYGNFNVYCASDSGGKTPLASAPPSGSHFYLDYSPAELCNGVEPNCAPNTIYAYLRAAKALNIYPVIKAMSVYGGYMGDTGYHLHPARVEGGQSYALAGVQDPWFSYDNAFFNSRCENDRDCYYSPFSLLYVTQKQGVKCPTKLCDISQHMQIAAPCVAVGLSGIKYAGLYNNNPAPCTELVRVTINGPGTVRFTDRTDGRILPTTTIGNLMLISGGDGMKMGLSAMPTANHKFAGWNGAACASKSSAVKDCSSCPDVRQSSRPGGSDMTTCNLILNPSNGIITLTVDFF